jgi:DNA primase
MKDVAAMYRFGINAVSTPSESTFVSDKQLEEFKNRFKHILVIYDSDRPGRYNMAKIRRKYPELDYFVIPSYLNAKDFSDLVKLYGIEKTKNMLNECLNYFRKKWEEH